ncbi:fimbrial protein [Pseudomonas chlororaphis]|uniref:fimbrial protein n=1 Tax=Pseudomonas chlororaphis TaxID=587753 RepID=UPI00155DA821|nr:fimbrial protein [Pseudomonas chlororaphis]
MRITTKPYSHSGPADSNWLGQQLGNSSGEQTNYTVFNFISCSAYGRYSFSYPVDSPIAGLTHEASGTSYPVYPTGVQGIGYVVGIRDPNASKWMSVKPPYQQVYPAPGQGSMDMSSLGFSVQMKLIATDRLKTGGYAIPAKVVATLRAADQNYQQIPGINNVNLWLNSTIVNVKASGCTVTPGSVLQTVSLPPASTTEFSGVGSSAAQSTSFSVAVDCDPDISVYATMTDATTPANTSDTLSLGRGSGADGIGLKLYKSGESTPVKFGPDSSGKNNTNQWYVGKSSTGNRNITIPFQARYVQTKPKIETGKVEASSTITFSYQ